MLYNLTQRPRRLRDNSVLRNSLIENKIEVADLILPVFVTDSKNEPEEIPSMPEVYRWPLSKLVDQIGRWTDQGIQLFAIFPCLDESLKDDSGTEILNSNSLVYRVARLLKENHPEIVLIGDLALDPYTIHGHDGILDQNKKVLNDETVEILSKAGVEAAKAGFNFVAPSDMMDGRVSIIRKNLDQSNFTETGIIAYSAKFCSSYYGPFRDAVGSSRKDRIDKSSYQLNPGNANEAKRELALDEIEGADILMIKPAEPYLDIIQSAKLEHNLPIAAYQVSGEYSRLWAAHSFGWLDLDACSMESILSIKRAGADLIFTYFAERISHQINQSTSSGAPPS